MNSVNSVNSVNSDNSVSSDNSWFCTVVIGLCGLVVADGEESGYILFPVQVGKPDSKEFGYLNLPGRFRRAYTI